MLTITNIKRYIEEAIEQFKEYSPTIEFPPIVVCPSANRANARAKILSDCGLDYKEDSLSMLGEVISGSKATKIVLYQAIMRTQAIVNHCVWHELGHILFGNWSRFGLTKEDMDRATIPAYGYGLLNEFMAEYIAYEVNNYQPLAGNYFPNGYLYQAFYESDDLIQYKLSMYYAILLGDSVFPEEEIEKGAEIISPSAWRIVCQIRNLLYNLTKADEFWNVDINFLTQLGYLCDMLLRVDFRV